MQATALIISNRIEADDTWAGPLSKAGLGTRVIPTSEISLHLTPSTAVVVDGASVRFDEEELLTLTGLIRSSGAVPAVSLLGKTSHEPFEDLLDDMCSGLVARQSYDVERIARGLLRRVIRSQRERFEYVTVTPNDESILAVFSDGECVRLPRPIDADDDGSDIVSIRLEETASQATLRLASGHELKLYASVSPMTKRRVISSRPAPANSMSDRPMLISFDSSLLGAKLKRLRTAAGLTQAELARRTGIHRPNIARVEAGRHTPSLETLTKLASAMGVTTTDILSEEAI